MTVMEQLDMWENKLMEAAASDDPNAFVRVLAEINSLHQPVSGNVVRLNDKRKFNND